MSKNLPILRRSASRLLALSLVEIDPSLLLLQGGELDVGFYYDFLSSQELSLPFLHLVEEHMRKVAKERRSFEWIEMTAKNGKEYVEYLGHHVPFERGEEQKIVSLFRCGNFADFCSAPCVKNSGEIGHFRLISIEKIAKKHFRIFGSVHWEEKGVKEEIKLLRCYEKKNHLYLGKKYRLFHEEKEGFCWHPAGMLLRERCIHFWKNEMQKQNFSLIETPFSNDRDNLFFHEEVFLREGKKIPFRSAEIFPIKEEPKKSILLEGLFSPSLAYRVVERSFLAPDQLLQESISSLQFIDNILNIFNFSKHVNWVFTSSKNPKMRKEEGILLTALQRVKRGLFRQEKGGKEPVIEIGIRDALHREWRGPSLCLRKGEEKYAIVERSSFGMIERWIALMIETTSLKSSPFFRQEGKGTL